MRIPRIFQAGEYIQGSTIELNPDIFQHLIKVLRLKSGDSFILFNGKGSVFTGVISTVSKKSCEVLLQSKQLYEPPLFKMTLAQAIIKPDKMDLVLQKAVELGVTHIVPLISDYCDSKLSQTVLEKKWQHWQKIIVAACEQCGVNYLPELLPAQLFNDWIVSQKNTNAIILDPLAEKTFAELSKQILAKQINQLLLAIGPEGGWSDVEINQAMQQDFIRASLGPRILRAETAAIASLAICQYQWDY